MKIDIHNCNSDITLKLFEEKELYDGLMVQSTGNLDHIYMMMKIDGVWYHQTWYKILDRGLLMRDEDLAKDKGQFEIVAVDREPFKRSSADIKKCGDHWLRTIYTIKVDKEYIREEKIKCLLKKKSEN